MQGEAVDPIMTSGPLSAGDQRAIVEGGPIDPQHRLYDDDPYLNRSHQLAS